MSENSELLRKININDFNYNLPEERIAKHPVAERSDSQLLIFKNNKISRDLFKNISTSLPEDSMLVFNNTKVIRARLLFRKKTGAIIEVFCLEPVDPEGYERSFSSYGPVEWKCITGNIKKWKTGILTASFKINEKETELSAQKIAPEGNAWRIRFSWNRKDFSFGEVIDAAGHIPLPPYLNRADEEEDKTRYQTVYSKDNGSVAAPTAGLHFTDDIIDRIRRKGIETTELTLHIGAGTFQPVKNDNIINHEMHREHFYITAEFIKKLITFQSRIIAVGTTSVRTLESLYWLGVKLLEGNQDSQLELSISQWEPYQANSSITLTESLEALLSLMRNRGTTILHAFTKIIIVPGYRFRVISGVITNFHQPKSTLLLLIAAWIGDSWKEIYNYALENNFRFLSYGDSSLLLR